MSATQDIPQEVINTFVEAGHGNLEKVKELYAQYPELLNMPRNGPGSETALLAAAHLGNREIAEFLLEEGAPLDICTAAMLGNVDFVAECLDRDPEQANAKGAHSIPVLFHAAIGGNADSVRLLLDFKSTEGLDRALHGAAKDGHAEVVALLLEHGVPDVNLIHRVSQTHKMTPLAVAIDKGYDAIADMLREHGGIAASEPLN